MEPSQQPAVIVIANKKSKAIAAILGFFFGPLGLLYSSLLGAAVMFIVSIPILFITAGFGIFITVPACAIWGFIAAANHNSKISSQVQGHM